MTIPKTRMSSSSKSGQEILAGEISGMQSFVHIVSPGDSCTVTSRQQMAQAFILVSGCGTVSTGARDYEVEEISLLVPESGSDTQMSCAGKELIGLELAISLSAGDAEELLSFAGKLPYFVSYPDCKTYREKIKSEKTINRTLLHEGVIPRLGIGSVETTGPDAVATHQHPMLEQLFVGLAGNSCTVSADGVEADFRENDILHIPLGSNHSVRVAEGRRLHYIWIDLFKNSSGMEWLRQEHIEDE